MIWGQDLLSLFQKGAFAMWPLLFCSILGVAVILERMSYFLRMRFNYDRFRKELTAFLAKGDIQGARKLSRRFSNPVPRLADQYLANLNYDALRQDILTREGSLAIEKLEARLRVLAAITHIAPLLGLLGTVTGLVGAFHQIELLGGQVQPSDLAGGIWEALLTTVFGLIIAIPCMAAYHGFESAADRIARRMKFIITDLDEYFGKHSFETGIRAEGAESREESMKGVH